jgi:hypothetical protein
MEVAPAALDPVLNPVELDVAGRKPFRDLGRLDPPQQRPHPGEQFRHGERLHDIIVGPGREPAHPVRFLAPRRQHDDRQALGFATKAKRRHNSTPDNPGSIQSSRARSGTVSRSMISASSPRVAVDTSYPSASRL